MKRLLLLLTRLLVITVFATCYAAAQGPAQEQPCSDPVDQNACAPGLNLAPGTFSATPLIDGSGQSYGDPDGNLVSLYGVYGNDEHMSSNQAAQAHYNQGVTLAGSITPRCPDGSVPPPNSGCQVGDLTKPPAIVFLFVGFSNCDIEICGGNSDAWDGKDNPPNGHLAGQPCSTQCRNLNYPGGGTPWNQVTNHGGDGVIQQSFLYQVYNPTPHLVGDHVVVFNSALGGQTLNRWDPTPAGYYASHDCPYGPDASNPECNYTRAQHDLEYNGYSDAQVQAIFLKSSDSFPQCDLKGLYCAQGAIPDAYLSEIYMGDIMRYLKCCTLDQDGHSTGQPRYPNLKQVFITSRIYGGYADPTTHGCLMPEPFAFEEGFAVQRLIVAQIHQAAGGDPTDPYSGEVNYGVTPWFDWGPYLWASGTNKSAGNQLFWCDSTTRLNPLCEGNLGDFRYGDDADPVTYWGDHTHPTYKAEEKVANQLVKFIKGQLPAPQLNISGWVTPWVGR